jgi:hypothetical protein
MLGYSRHKYHALLTSQTMTAQGKKLLMFDFDNRFVKKLIVNLFICLVNPNNEASNSDIENNYILKDTKLLLKKKEDTKYFFFFYGKSNETSRLPLIK